ncbi:FKBP-type peptidyl-prolyl isomerase-like protein [Roseivirga pacifica]|uniref:Peptidyl-prolyl cis-trans isomerase n=1 Tax=Roseivirga pacifica TaxID=1267423 RepID=A0A1I0NV83_9BACT|nr:FKBP-type peptidyl-prolyl cis-trans isomerase [Roseivirga pacifica]MCO6359980.1 hypothetical protein [Roseivirga pacifica]MCO6367350.1 hypothetical protein [Roseivirga pacifica]MCO6370119.1 hypothetical protein [Roseivirga pacifica]MCO6375007.1 hypothetical protein [Roseivirga pacifica]MCO6380265.1 hypothetical protein [Roseivirga pacifica]
MKKLVLGLSVFLAFGLSGCLNSDDGPSYDPVAQLEVDGEKIDLYLEANDIQAETHDTGIRYVITAEGNGTFPEEGQVVSVDYELYRIGGSLLDTSKEDLAKEEGIYNSDRDYAPLRFTLGTSQLIPGFQIATLLLSEEGSGDFYIPSVLAYRNIGSTSVMPNENLLFKISLVEVEQ